MGGSAPPPPSRARGVSGSAGRLTCWFSPKWTLSTLRNEGLIPKIKQKAEASGRDFLCCSEHGVTVALQCPRHSHASRWGGSRGEGCPQGQRYSGRQDVQAQRRGGGCGWGGRGLSVPTSQLPGRRSGDPGDQPWGGRCCEGGGVSDSQHWVCVCDCSGWTWAPEGVSELLWPMGLEHRGLQRLLTPEWGGWVCLAGPRRQLPP